MDALRVADRIIIDNKKQGQATRTHEISQNESLVITFTTGKFDLTVIPGNEFIDPDDSDNPNTIYSVKIEANFQRIRRRTQVKLLGIIPIPHKLNETKRFKRALGDDTGNVPSVRRPKPTKKKL